MPQSRLARLVAGSGSVAAFLVGCAGAGDDPSGLGAPTGNPSASAANSGAGQCVACVTDSDCGGGEVCAQFQGDTFCAVMCPNEDECGSGTSCAIESSYNGNQVNVCVPDNNACGSPGSSGTPDGSQPPPPPPPPACDAGSPNTCGSLVGPTVAAQCHSCSSSSNCQANGCYGGWWCDTSTNKCQAQPSTCMGGGSGNCSSDDAGSITVDAGGPVTGTPGANGGTVSRLLFTVVGDTRPANEDETSGYPTTIINQIYGDIAALNPMPPFSVSTGDYQFANPSGSQSTPQLSLYLAARAKYSGAFYPAMGNHECTGATASNCGSGNSDGVTSNYTNFLSMLLGPLQKTLPYYSISINASDSSWTSKFVFVAANAWDSAQSSWLSGVMAQATTYTFVIRHEATGTSGPPGVSPSDSIIKSFPYTLLIVGHSHTYSHPSTKEALFGNGGAPLTGSSNYGYGLLSQRSDGALTVDMIDYQSGQADSSFHFVITAAGTLTQ